ncbi:MAG: hypothetical protein LBB73_03980 [Dysgonamonadaceae bacterium]|nr:hypothetical protein [Dysgonamonadaceae bacterium]
METRVKTRDTSKPNSRITSLKTRYPRYVPTMVENDAPNAFISTIIATNPSNPNQIL